MTGLLVSVRSAAEARAALAGGADLIDVKEPHRGPLGAADPALWREVEAEIGSAVPLSAALGELSQHTRSDPRRLGATYRYAKVGLAQALGLGDWKEEWRRLLDTFPAHVSSVAVI